jgi:hypothetical protein
MHTLTPKTLVSGLVLTSALLLLGTPAPAQSSPAAAATASPAPNPVAGAARAAVKAATAAVEELNYEKFTLTGKKETGLFTVWRKAGKVYIELSKDQLDKEYYEHATTVNGLGGYGILSGDDFQMQAVIVKFVRTGPTAIAVVLPQIRFQSQPGTPIDIAVKASTADSVQAVAAIVAEDKDAGKIVFDASFLLGDTLDLGATLTDALEKTNPAGAYHLDTTKTYFGPAKTFPKNVVIEADQTFVSMKPITLNTVVDPRSVQFRVKYNFAELMSTPGYMPRLEDDRVGFWDDPFIQFDKDNRWDNHVHYILRRDIEASDPSKPSPAKKPLVYTLTNTIPMQYRAAIRDAILEWNKAFVKIGILDAIQVVDQPNDPTWDPDDIRYNTIRWLPEANDSGFAEAQIEWDPRTGEIFRSGVLIDADLMRFGKLIYADEVPGAINPDPASPLSPAQLGDPALWDPTKIDPTVWGFAPKRRAGTFMHRDTGALAQAQFGALAFELYGENVPDDYTYLYLKSLIMHEVGHDFGLGHNFMGHGAFSATELRDKAFTGRNGVASSVMEYAPINLWPKGASHGDLFSPTIGPYDYHVIHWGYAPIAGAKSPEDEIPTLDKWASVAVDPHYAFASDEDVAYNGHAVDPRIAQFMLTNDPISWCETQLGIDRGLMKTLDTRLPHPQETWEEEQYAFRILVNQYSRCSNSMTHYVAGEYLTRSRQGDPGVRTALTPIPRNLERRAFANLSRYVFAENALDVSPTTLNRLVYTEYAPFADFYYNPTIRHDLSLQALLNSAQYRALSYMFSPIVLQRLDDMSSKAAPGATMSVADLFAWTQYSIFGKLANGHLPTTPAARNLQRTYTRLLINISEAPSWAKAGTPLDAQALAQHELVELSGYLKMNLMHGDLDLQTRSHLEAMSTDVRRALEARNVLVPT